jgi:hypothetical protein
MFFPEYNFKITGVDTMRLKLSRKTKLKYYGITAVVQFVIYGGLYAAARRAEKNLENLEQNEKETTPTE